MNETAFFDTNILVYMHDQQSDYKQGIARELFGKYFSERRGALSTQVIQEFFVSVTGKAARMPILGAKKLVADYLQLNVITVQPAHILDAIEIQSRHQLSFWDALVLAAAKSAGATLLFSEDFSHGRVYDGVRAHNPFRG